MRKQRKLFGNTPTSSKNIVIRMSEFHTICTLLARIGKRFQDAGFRDLCIESGIIAEGSVTGVMDGRMYNWALRCHTLLYEVDMGFLSWVDENNTNCKTHLDNMLKNVHTLCESICSSTFLEIVDSIASIQFMELFGKYLEFLRSGNGRLSAFWMTYIDIVDNLLDMIRPSRDGNWNLHLASIRKMIPWCFENDRHMTVICTLFIIPR